jgi:hypothetical protein
MKINRNDISNDGVITAEEIKLILERYRIGKKPLAKLLGWGETTIIRYMEGDTPTSEYSNKLKTIMESPECYYELLEQRKDCLTNVAYRKSKRAVLSSILSSKIYAAAHYIVHRTNGDISAKYIQYLLYYAQVFSLAIYNKEFFPEECLVNKEYIPFVKIYKGMKCCGIPILEISDEYLTVEERELLDIIYDNFSWYGPRALSALSIYDRSNLKISRDQYNNRIFSKDTLKNFYKGILEEYKIENIQDIARYPDIRIRELREA